MCKNRFFSCLFVALSLHIFGWTAEKYDYSHFLHIPPGSHETEGNQILHFKPTNKHYKEDEQAQAFVEEYLQGAVPLSSDAEVWIRSGGNRGVIY